MTAGEHQHGLPSRRRPHDRRNGTAGRFRAPTGGPAHDGRSGAGAEPPVIVFSGASRLPAHEPDRISAAPVRLPSEHEQATHELALVTALVLNAPQAAHSLDLLVNSARIHPEGALVFAGLLYLTDRTDAAQFWWQFAAGGGSQTAAYCLHLYHLLLGEPRDAAYWRAQADRLAGHPRPRPNRGLATAAVRGGAPLLPEEVRRDILARCHRGLLPRLPIRLEAVINRLVVTANDDDFGEIPQPSDTLVGDLASTC
ncbi:hypothetical protein ACIGXM_27730 [Kitasatospora sp. NPDC052896]|uniref:hypothetical protein n=1 Tax=Kitasatospora sp. NPDC052896 TaxID=3364061 RepID=UPI0037C8EF85